MNVSEFVSADELLNSVEDQDLEGDADSDIDNAVETLKANGLSDDEIAEELLKPQHCYDADAIGDAIARSHE